MNLSRKPIAAALLAAALLLGAGRAQAQVTVPNTFSAGTPASSAQVNQNFQALANAVNAANAALDAANSAIAALNAATSTLNTALNTTNTALGTTNTTLGGVQAMLSGEFTPVPVPYRVQASATSAPGSLNVAVLRQYCDCYEAYLVRIAFRNDTGLVQAGGNFSWVPAYLYWDISVSYSPYICADAQCGSYVSGWYVSQFTWGSDTADFATYVETSSLGGLQIGYTVYPTDGGWAWRYTRQMGCPADPQYYNLGRWCVTRTEDVSAGTGPFYTMNPVQNVLMRIVCATGCLDKSYTVNSVVLSDVAMDTAAAINETCNPCLRAPNVGAIEEVWYSVIWYRANGTAQGDLAGTAFDASALTGIWFTQ